MISTAQDFFVCLLLLYFGIEVTMTKVYLLLFLCTMFVGFTLAYTEPRKARIDKLKFYKRQRYSPPPARPQPGPLDGVTGLLNLKGVALPSAPKIPSVPQIPPTPTIPNLFGSGGDKDED